MTYKDRLYVLSEIDVANRSVTVTLQVALKLEPSVVVAVMVTEPGATAVTNPLLLTLAMDVLLDLQVTFLLVVLLG